MTAFWWSCMAKKETKRQRYIGGARVERQIEGVEPSMVILIWTIISNQIKWNTLGLFIHMYPMLILTWMPMIQNSDEFFSSFSSFSLYAQVFNNAMSLSIISISLEMKASTDWIDFNNFHLRFFFFYLGNIHLNNVGDGFFFQTNAISEWISERNAWWNGNN